MHRRSICAPARRTAALAALALLGAALPAAAEPPVNGKPEVEDEEESAEEAARPLPAGGGWYEERLAELARELDARIAGPRAAATLYRLASLDDRLPALAPLAKVLGRAARHPKAPGDVKALAAWQLAKVELARGRLPRARAGLARLGFADAGWLAGGFDNEGGTGHDAVPGPESAPVDLKAVYAGKEREVSWRRLPALGPDGVVPLGDLLRPRKNSTFYFLTSLEADAPGRAVLKLGTAGATKVWVNGAPVLADRADHPARFDQTSVPISLKKGTNPVLVKVSVLAEMPALYLRATDPQGRPLAGAKWVAPAEGAPVQAVAVPGPAEAPAAPERNGEDLAAVLARQADAAPADGTLREDLATVLAERRPYDTKTQRARREQERAEKLLPTSARAAARLAALVDDDHNERRRALERALAVDPAFVPARAELGRYYLERGFPRRAVAELQRALADRPDFWPAELALCSAYEALGLEARARAATLALAARLPTVAEVVRAAARVERSLGRNAEAAARYRVVLALRYDDGAARGELVSLLTDRGDVDAAALELQKALELTPTALSPGLRLAALLSANGRDADALARYDRLAALVPDDEGVAEARGRHKLRTGDAAGALEDFERALALKPQNPALRELVGSLRPRENFAAPWLRDAAALAAAARKGPAPGPAEDAVVLSDVLVVRVYPNGLSSRTSQRVVRVVTDRGVEAERSRQLRYTPGAQEIRVEKARVFKPDGTVVEARQESDRALTEPWAGMYFDLSAKTITFPNLAPGDVVELVWRQDDTSRENMFADYFGDVWMLQDDDRRLDTQYVLVAPPEREFHANEPALPGLERKVETDGRGRRVWSWRARDVPRIEPEPRMPGWVENAAYLHVSTFREWDEVARFWWGLVKEQLHPTPEVRRAAEEAVRGLDPKDVAGRVRAVYRAVVRGTRYVGLEFGIHGFKPYPVDRVLARRFGDCKDKASLMHAMLETLGIPSRLVLLRMHHLGRLAPRPASLAVFNHAILYVPALDLFLDGTAEFSGSLELPASDEGAQALVVEEDGKTASRFLVTPFSAPARNTTRTEARVELAADGSARSLGRTRVAGQPAASWRQHYESESGRAERFEQSLARSWPGAGVADLALSDPRELEQPVEARFAVALPRYARPLDGGLELSPFGEPFRYVESLAPLSKRQHPLDLGSPWRTEMRYEVRLPPGLAPVEPPAVLGAAGPFGSYRVTIGHEPGALVVDAELSLSASRVEPAQYEEFRAFLADLDRTFSRRLRLAPARAPEAALPPAP